MCERGCVCLCLCVRYGWDFVRVWISESPGRDGERYTASSAFGIILVISIITDTMIVSALERSRIPSRRCWDVEKGGMGRVVFSTNPYGAALLLCWR